MIAGQAGKPSNDSALSGLTGAQRAVVALRDGMRVGRYVPGQRLIEVDLVRDIGVGRNSLREAFSRLASEGLVAIEPHRGASIRKRTRSEVAELYDISEALEGMAARNAAERISLPADAELLHAAVNAQAAAVSVGIDAQIDAGAAFHETIVQMSDNPRLMELCANLHVLTFTLTLRHGRLAADHPLSSHSLTDHREVAEAVLRGDPQHAEDVMRSHVRNSKQRLIELPDNVFA